MTRITATSYKRLILGVGGEKNELSYGLTTSYDMPKEGGHESSIGANGSYRTHYAYLNTSASAGKNQQQYSLGTSGALVAHEGGGDCDT